MSETLIARIFNDRSGQVVRMPSEFHLPGDRVRVRRGRHPA